MSQLAAGSGLARHPGEASGALSRSAFGARRNCWSTWLQEDQAKKALRFGLRRLAKFSGGGTWGRHDRLVVFRCSLPAEGKDRKGGTQRIGDETRGARKRKKHQGKLRGGSGDVNGDGGTIVTSGRRQLPPDLTPQQGKGSASGVQQEGGTTPSEDAPDDGASWVPTRKFGKWLYPGIAGVAVAGVAWVVAPQALELLAASNVQMKPPLGVEYERTAGDGSVERILARELAKR